MDLKLVLDNYLRENPSSIEGTRVRPAKEGVYSDFPSTLNPRLASALQANGIKNLYSHQAKAFDEVSKGNNVVIVTPTASGKTLCYNLPVVNTLLDNPDLKAIYLFPTKALAQDQTKELNQLLSSIQGNNGLRVYTYDGDTPQSLRQSIRTKGQIIITNPDMLHSGILPNHPKWIKIFKKLKYVIIDEIHTYKGVFGSHFANLMERLSRIAAYYGGNIQFVTCSATIANPQELTEKLISRKTVLINESGAPQGEKHFIFHNPPLIDVEQGIRRGTILESVHVAVPFIKAGYQTIIFAGSRLKVELITSYLRKRLPENAKTIFGYRGGYLPNERRDIERGIKNKEYMCVVSTNALELGVDIGSLDIAILAGYPGTVASFFQQTGRSGRKNRLSVAILIAGNNPLDQFLVRNSVLFEQQASEAALINPKNIYIFLDHIKCASFEIPFSKDETFRGENIQDILKFLEESHIVKFTDDKYYWTEDAYPAENVSLRSTNIGNFIIVDTTGGKQEIIGETDRGAVITTLYPEAIYIHLGKQYQVRKLDWDGQKAFVEESNADYYTDALSKTDLKILNIMKEEEAINGMKLFLEVLVRTMGAKFKKIRYQTHENIGFGDIQLPVEEMHTTSFALSLPEEEFNSMKENDRPSVLQSIGYALRNIAPLYLFCSPQDIGLSEQMKPALIEKPTIFIYDRYPGGIGLAEQLFKSSSDLVLDALMTVRSCPCEQGCPSCIGAQDEYRGSGNIKGLVLNILQKISLSEQ